MTSSPVTLLPQPHVNLTITNPAGGGEFHDDHPFASDSDFSADHMDMGYNRPPRRGRGGYNPRGRGWGRGRGYGHRDMPPRDHTQGK